MQKNINMLNEIIASCPDYVDLTNATHLELVKEKVDEFDIETLPRIEAKGISLESVTSNSETTLRQYASNKIKAALEETSTISLFTRRALSKKQSALANTQSMI